MTINKRVTALILPLVPLALAGCAATSVKGLQEREPVLVADSKRDSNAIVACVSTAWMKLSSVTPKAVPRETGTLLVLGDAVPSLVIETSAGPAGTHVVMHQLKTLWSDDNRHRVEEVQACL